MPLVLKLLRTIISIPSIPFIYMCIYICKVTMRFNVSYVCQPIWRFATIHIGCCCKQSLSDFSQLERNIKWHYSVYIQRTISFICLSQQASTRAEFRLLSKRNGVACSMIKKLMCFVCLESLLKFSFPHLMFCVPANVNTAIRSFPRRLLWYR